MLWMFSSLKNSDENNPTNDYPEEEYDSELSLDAETNDTLSGSEEDEKQSVKSVALEEYDREVLEESEEDWDSADYDERSC